MQEMPQSSKGVQGDWLSGISMQELQPQVMPTFPLEGCVAVALSAAITFFRNSSRAAVLPGNRHPGTSMQD